MWKSSTNIKKNRIPWWTPEIQELIRERRCSERRHYNNPTERTLIAFRQAQAKARYHLKKARKETWKYYINKIRCDTPSKPGKMTGK
jgi:hypothetical protein